MRGDMGKEVGRRGGGRGGEEGRGGELAGCVPVTVKKLFMSSFIRLSGLFDIGSVAIPETYTVSKFCFLETLEDCNIWITVCNFTKVATT